MSIIFIIFVKIKINMILLRCNDENWIKYKELFIKFKYNRYWTTINNKKLEGYLEIDEKELSKYELKSY